jgi:hypothetical protein
MPEDDFDVFNDENFRDAEPDEKPPVFHAEDEDPEEEVKEVEEPEDDPGAAILDKLEGLDPDQKEWYSALLAVAIDKHEGRMQEAIQQANEIFESYPKEPVEPPA